MSKIDIKKPELVWKGKYDDEGNLNPIDRPGPYPFQIVETINSPRKGKKSGDNLTLYDFWDVEEGDSFETGWTNKLIWGDNKLVMSSLIEKFSGKIDLIYIDPPFATGTDFRLKVKVGEEGEEIQKEHSILEEKAYRDTWGEGLESYLNMMYERLFLMKELLSETGSIYVHCDWHVGHFLKLILDEIFGNNNFRNEIVWKNSSVKNDIIKKDFPVQHNIIFLYTKSDKYNFNPIFIPFDDEYIKVNYRLDDNDGNGLYTTGPLYSTTSSGGYANSKPFEFMGITKRWIYSKETMEKWKDEGKIYQTNSGGFRKKVYLKDSKGRPVTDLWIDSNVMFLTGSASEYVDYATQKPENLLKRIIQTSSNEGDIVADFFCGSGTTLIAAEKLRRRWIGVDLTRYAVHTTRKRLLEIQNSNDILGDNNKNHAKKANSFEILNLGKYERQYWKSTTFNSKDPIQAYYEYISFILKLYGAEPINGSQVIHGKRSNALVYVGSIDAPVTINEIVNAITETKKIGQKELHVLGWEWEMGLNDAIEQIAKRENINLKLRIIPNEVLEKQAIDRGDINFFELAYFKPEIKLLGKEITIELTDFIIPHTDLISKEVRDKIKKWSDWIDYWAIDFNFQNDTFVNSWTSYRTKKDRALSLKANHKYMDLGNHKVFIKVIDIFGIDTSQIYEVTIK